jgi:hypothetical protein
VLLIIVSLGPESYFARDRMFEPVMELFLCGRYDNLWVLSSPESMNVVMLP